MIVADTSAWIDYVRGIDAPHTECLDRELLRSRLATGDIIIAEFLQGFRTERDFRAARQILDRLEYYDFLGKERALRAAGNYRLLRKKGITVRKTVDVIIASFCVDMGFELIHNDRDFDAMEKILGLRVLR
ncbi:MAG: PIN domain nuclease [Treponema sp.]|nr:PIN domain nuclease [Treponema sp.]